MKVTLVIILQLLTAKFTLYLLSLKNQIFIVELTHLYTDFKCRLICKILGIN